MMQVIQNPMIRFYLLTMSFYELEPTDSISIIKHLTAFSFTCRYPIML